MVQKRVWKNCLLALCCAVMLVGMTAQPQAVETSASAAILIEADSGRVLYEHNADQQMLIASTTKIMTALVVLESCDLDEMVPITQAHMAEGSSMYLQPGEELTVETLLYGLLLCSGNDAALALADHCGPGVEVFVEKMNDKAKELGLVNTSFANPNGLDDEQHYSTARDMARLAAYAMENETFSRIVSTKSITIDGRTMTNHNKLLSRYEGCIGLKTGYTRAAGRTLVSCAVRDGMKLIAVTLKDGNDWADHAALFDYGFSQYQMQSPAVRGKAVCEIPVLNGTEQKVSLCYGADFSYPVQAGETLEVQWNIPECTFAPVKDGEQAGEAVYCFNGQEIGRVPLHYGASVEPLQVPRSSGIFERVISYVQRMTDAA